MVKSCGPAPEDCCGGTPPGCPGDADGVASIG